MAKSIVDQLQRAIRDSGQTEYAIAKGSGVSQSVVNRFVSGERGISFETAAKLSQHFNLELVRRGGGGSNRQRKTASRRSNRV